MRSRARLELEVDELAAAHTGEAFARAVRELSLELDQAERELLQAVLLERARIFEEAVEERFVERSWITRTLRRIERKQEELRSPLGNDPPL